MVKKRLKYINAQLILDTPAPYSISHERNSETTTCCFSCSNWRWCEFEQSSLWWRQLAAPFWEKKDLLWSLWQCAGVSGQFSLDFEHPRLGRLDRLHIIGRVKTELAVIQATFTPALIVLVFQLRQQITLIDKKGQKEGGGFNETPLSCILQPIYSIFRVLCLPDVFSFHVDICVKVILTSKNLLMKFKVMLSSADVIDVQKGHNATNKFLVKKIV